MNNENANVARVTPINFPQQNLSNGQGTSVSNVRATQVPNMENNNGQGQVFNSNLNQRINQNLNQGINQKLNQRVNPNLNQGVNSNLNQGINTNIQTNMTFKIDRLDPNEFPMLCNYCEDLTAKQYVTNPAIDREEEIKRTMLVLLTPDKSALLIGKAGIGKTAIVEGIAYKIQRNMVPNALSGYKILKINSSSMVGKINVNGRQESIINLVVNELKKAPKTILFIDEVHTLIGGSKDGPMDLANILKPALDRGDIKAIGATTTMEYETYIVRDRAFLRRFDRIEVLEPSRSATIDILMGTIPKIEHSTGIKMINNHYIATLLVESIVDATSEFKRVYGLSAMYPDVALSVLSASFSNALFENKPEVGIIDVYNAIKDSKRIYPDSRLKECESFREKFKRICDDHGIVLPVFKLEDIDTGEDL